MADDQPPDEDVPERLCDCCDPAERIEPGRDRTDRTQTDRDPQHISDSWQPTSGLLETPLPADLQTALGTVLGVDEVATVGAWVDAVRRHTGGGSIAVEDLCLTAAETEHWGELDGERYYFRCFYDAVLLAALADRPVDIRTVSPGGTVIEAAALGSDSLAVDPSTAVFSFGVIEGVEPPVDDGPTHERIYEAVCPAVRAFPEREAYERWTDGTAVVTVGAPLSDATALATALTRR